MQCSDIERNDRHEQLLTAGAPDSQTCDSVLRPVILRVVRVKVVRTIHNGRKYLQLRRFLLAIPGHWCKLC